MTSTLKIPGMPVFDAKVDDQLASFVSDLLYMTFFSESTKAEGGKFLTTNISEAFQAVALDVDPADVQTLFNENAQALLAGPYSGSSIEAASITLVLEEETSRGRILHWKLTITSEGQLITGTLTGNVAYDLN